MNGPWADAWVHDVDEWVHIEMGLGPERQGRYLHGIVLTRQVEVAHGALYGLPLLLVDTPGRGQRMRGPIQSLAKFLSFGFGAQFEKTIATALSSRAPEFTCWPVALAWVGSLIGIRSS